MKLAPRGIRCHIGLFGRRNVGKSSLLNALTRQAVSIVSEFAGTTTDPVEKAMELLPLGPVQFIDTAGLDDEGLLGAKRVEATRRIVDRTDLALVIAVGEDFGELEEQLLGLFQEANTPVIVVFNKTDCATPAPELLANLERRKIPVQLSCVTRHEGVDDLREAIIRHAPEEFLEGAPLLGDLLTPGDTVVLVTPIDLEAPKGRLILPQVQAIRDALDHDALCFVVKENHLSQALASLNKPPALVVTDSQAFDRVAADTPDGVPMTSFSILFARFKGDLPTLADGVKAMVNLKGGDRVLVAEACTHHPICDDIGRVKLPAWVRKYSGANLEFVHTQGHDFPKDLSPYALVIHCGACMINRREVLARIARCRQAGVPITNYGVSIAQSLGILDRALKPFGKAR